MNKNKKRRVTPDLAADTDLLLELANITDRHSKCVALRALLGAQEKLLAEEDENLRDEVVAS